MMPAHPITTLGLYRSYHYIGTMGRVRTPRCQHCGEPMARLYTRPNNATKPLGFICEPCGEVYLDTGRTLTEREPTPFEAAWAIIKKDGGGQ